MWDTEVDDAEVEGHVDGKGVSKVGDVEFYAGRYMRFTVVEGVEVEGHGVIKLRVAELS